MSKYHLYDPLDPRIVADPYPAYRQLQRRVPVCFESASQSWLISRHAHIRLVLSDYHSFTSDWSKVGVLVPANQQTIQSMDPPDSLPIHDAFTAALSRIDYQPIKDRLNTELHHRLTPISEHENETDLISQLTDPLALVGICALLGVDPAQATTLPAIAALVSRGMDLAYFPNLGTAAEQARQDATELALYWLAHPLQQGLLAILAADGVISSLGALPIARSLRSIFLGAYISFSNFLGLALLALLEHPAQLANLRDFGPDQRAIAELLRYTSPIQAIVRASRAPFRLAGVSVPQAAVLTLLLGAANRDPEVFFSPNQLKLQRHPNPHLTLAHGVHGCLGRHFIAEATTTILEYLTPELLDMIISRPPTFKKLVTLRGLESLYVKYHPTISGLRIALYHSDAPVNDRQDDYQLNDNQLDL